MNNPVLLIALPLITAFLLPVVSRVSMRFGLLLGPVVLLMTSIMGILIWSQLGGNASSVQLGGFRPPLGIVLYVDELAILFTLATHLGTLLLWPRDVADPVRSATLALVLAACGSGLALSGDLFNIYVFYELAAVVSYGLIAGRASPASLAATLRFLILAGFGAALALMGIALVYQATGTLNLAQLAQLAPERLQNTQGLAAFLLILIGFGVKAELFPVNTWVPEVYATAPARVSGLLAGVVSKLALLIILRLLILVFHQPEALQVMLVLGILGVVSGELAAWRAHDFRRMIAFSSIGQLGILFIAFSIPGQAGLFAGLAVALHHLLLKPALFLLAERWGGSLAELAGAAKASPVAAALFVILALSLAGVPPLPGFWAKLLVLTELAGQDQWLYTLGGFVILAGAVLEVSYLFRVVSKLYGPAGVNRSRLVAHRMPDLVTAGSLTAVLVTSMFLLAPMAERLEGIASQAADVPSYIQTVNPLSLNTGGRP